VFSKWWVAPSLNMGPCLSIGYGLYKFYLPFVDYPSCWVLGTFWVPGIWEFLVATPLTAPPHTLHFKFLTLCTSSPPFLNLNLHPFSLPLLSPSHIPLSLYFLEIIFLLLLSMTVAYMLWCGPPSFWVTKGMWVVSRIFWAFLFCLDLHCIVLFCFLLISTYQRVHTICVPLWLGYLTQDDIFKFHPFACEFHEVIVFNSWVVPLGKCTAFSVSIPLLRDIWVVSIFWLL
jgi:hypothetical protein